MSLMQSVRKVLRRDVLTICLVIFFADVMSGVMSPTFSLYAQQLGASLTLIGALSSVVGVTRLFASVPIGVFSDRIGRKTVLTLGMLLFSASAVLYAIAPDAYWLFPGRVLSGLAMVATFFIGAAYVGDIVTPEERGLAYGLYTTSMGSGFTVGPLIGAAIEVRYGIAASYVFAAGLTGLGALIAARGLRPAAVVEAQIGSSPRRAPWAGMGTMFANRGVLAGSLGNLLMSLSFGGAISNFFPVLVAEYNASQAAISSMFSARAFASTLARLPTGALTSRVTSKVVMSAALVLAMGVQLLMAQTSRTALLALLLLVEGIAFGTFLTSGQVFVAENCTPTTRGAAVGAYSTAGSLGSTLSSVVLGFIADRWGVPMVFRVTGVAILGGLVMIAFLSSQREEVMNNAECAVADEV